MFNNFQLVQFLQLGKSCHMTVTKLGEIFPKMQYTCFAWAGGTFFPVVLLCCVSVWFWREQGFDLHTHVLLRVQNSCGGVWREIVFGVTYVLSVQYRSLLRPEKKVLVGKKKF